MSLQSKAQHAFSHRSFSRAARSNKLVDRGESPDEGKDKADIGNEKHVVGEAVAIAEVVQLGTVG